MRVGVCVKVGGVCFNGLGLVMGVACRAGRGALEATETDSWAQASEGPGQ